MHIRTQCAVLIRKLPTEHEGLLKAMLLYEMAGLKATGKIKFIFWPSARESTSSKRSMR